MPQSRGDQDIGFDIWDLKNNGECFTQILDCDQLENAVLETPEIMGEVVRVLIRRLALAEERAEVLNTLAVLNESYGGFVRQPMLCRLQTRSLRLVPMKATWRACGCQF